MLLEEHRRERDQAELAMMRALRVTVPACLTKDGNRAFREAEAALRQRINDDPAAPGC